MKSMVKIFIDPGHGGTDPGGAGTGLLEKNITLEIGTRVRSIQLNEYQGALVRMSCSGDQTVSLKRRTDAANSWGADFLLSLHVNAGGGTDFHLSEHHPSRDNQADKLRRPREKAGQFPCTPRITHAGAPH